MQYKASPSLAAPFLKNYQEKKHLMQVQLAEDLNVEPHTLRFEERREEPTEVAT
jgi:DNA-binding XRE family transcriptional regulator